MPYRGQGSDTSRQLNQSHLGSISNLPVKSIEGYILLVTGIHPEAREDDLIDILADFGKISQLDLELDRRTGYTKGYAFVMFPDESEAKRACKDLNGKKLLGKRLAVDWAITTGPIQSKRH